ncbi:YdcF family protein, partial [Hyalangium sp.]|uniref:YdcF family protein n=1 Tax=Hyalangium sp. TaxID=2028555 RepID=UPI002D56791D
MPVDRLSIVVVLGQGFAPPSRAGGLRLTLESRLCARAAARLLAEGRAPLLVFSGGRTAGPHHPSEAAVMWRYACRHAPVDAASRVRLEELSIDTADNAHRVSALLGEQEVVLVAPAAHLRRATHHFRRHGLPVHEAWEA